MPVVPSGPAIKPIIPKAPRYLSFGFQCLNSLKRKNRQNRNRNQGLWYPKAAKPKKPLNPKKPGKLAKNLIARFCFLWDVARFS